MNQQIIITRNDEGIELEVQFINNKKKPVDITGCTVEVAFKNPMKEVEQHQAYIKDYAKGIAGIILDRQMTYSSGLWSTYWSAITETGFVTSQEAINYYVMSRYGGADSEENS